MKSTEPLPTGSWNESTSWEMHESNIAPPLELCTAVACIALAGVNLDKVVLTRNHRGWEVLAGHIEPGESLDDTLRREAMEEGGFTISDAELFGYLKITATKRAEPGTRGANYPYPHSYIPYFVARTESAIKEPVGEEIVKSKTFTLDEVEALTRRGRLTRMNFTIIDLGLKAARNIWAKQV
jgi:8-oxo-dGTP pyrophosphatase MutT (NUDIX family)